MQEIEALWYALEAIGSAVTQIGGDVHRILIGISVMKAGEPEGGGMHTLGSRIFLGTGAEKWGQCSLAMQFVHEIGHTLMYGHETWNYDEMMSDRFYRKFSQVIQWYDIPEWRKDLSKEMGKGAIGRTDLEQYRVSDTGYMGAGEQYAEDFALWVAVTAPDHGAGGVVYSGFQMGPQPLLNSVDPEVMRAHLAVMQRRVAQYSGAP